MDCRRNVDHHWCDSMNCNGFLFYFLFPHTCIGYAWCIPFGIILLYSNSQGVLSPAARVSLSLPSSVHRRSVFQTKSESTDTVRFHKSIDRVQEKCNRKKREKRLKIVDEGLRSKKNKHRDLRKSNIRTGRDQKRKRGHRRHRSKKDSGNLETNEIPIFTNQSTNASDKAIPNGDICCKTILSGSKQFDGSLAYATEFWLLLCTHEPDGIHHFEWLWWGKCSINTLIASCNKVHLYPFGSILARSVYIGLQWRFHGSVIQHRGSKSTISYEKYAGRWIFVLNSCLRIQSLEISRERSIKLTKALLANARW